jgi:hypothetical protein
MRVWHVVLVLSIASLVSFVYVICSVRKKPVECRLLGVETQVGTESEIYVIETSKSRYRIPGSLCIGIDKLEAGQIFKAIVVTSEFDNAKALIVIEDGDKW